MEESSTTPPQPTLGGPMPPAGQSPQPQMPVVAGGPQKSKLPLVIAIVVVLLLAAGGAYYLMKSGNKPASNTANTQQTQQTTATNESATTASTFTNPDNSASVSVTHPKSWEVNTDPDADGVKQLTIKSPMGNYLHLYPDMGVGGACDPDTYSYTLVKRITTQDANYVFSEYTTTNPDNQLVKFSLEPLAGATAAHKALKEGEGGTNVCANLFYYPVANDIFVKIDTSAKPDSNTAVPYATLKNDTRFITMLESLTVKSGQ